MFTDDATAAALPRDCALTARIDSERTQELLAVWEAEIDELAPEGSTTAAEILDGFAEPGSLPIKEPLASRMPWVWILSVVAIGLLLFVVAAILRRR